MPYMEQLQSGLKNLVDAGEAGRTSLDGMLGPLTGAVSDMTGAASELEGLPIIGPAIGAKLQRTMSVINAAQSRVGEVAAKYGQAVSAAGQVQERLGTLKEQAAKAVEAPKAPAPQIDQKFTFSPTIGVTVQGDVKDPAQLARELAPYLQRQFDDFARQAAARQLSDEPHV